MLPIKCRFEGELERELDYLLCDISFAASNADRLDVVKTIEQFAASMPYAKMPYTLHACVMARTLNSLLTDEQRKEIHEDVFLLMVSTAMHLSELISRIVSVIAAYGKDHNNHVGQLAYLKDMKCFVYNCRLLNNDTAILVNEDLLCTLEVTLGAEISRLESLIKEKEE